MLDGAVSPLEIASRYGFLEQLPYPLNDIDTDETAYSRHWKAALPVPLATPLLKRCISLTQELMGVDPARLRRVHSNLHLYPDVQFPHVDFTSGVTALYHANPAWAERWLGETTFYDENREPIYAVAPKPGRLALFHGDILHRSVYLRGSAINRGSPSRSGFADPGMSVTRKHEDARDEAATTSLPQIDLPRVLLPILREACRGRTIVWPSCSGDDDVDEFLAFTKRHGMQPLLAHELQGAPRLSEWPPLIRTTLGQVLRAATAVEPVEQAEIGRVLSALAADGVRAVLFKGAAVAYTVYPLPFLRPRQDNDVLVTARDVERARSVLTRLGYGPVDGTEGDLVVGQQDWIMADDRGVVHRLDLHWRISNVQFFARAMPAEDLLTRVVSVPALGEHVRVLGSVDALLIACVHRVAHHPANGKLIWLADLRHIGARLTPKDWDVFGSRAHEWRVSAICAAGLTQARQLFAAPVPDDVLTRLERNSRDEPPMARQLVGGRQTALRSLALDLKALPGIRLKARLLFQHAFPTPKFLLRMYSTSRRSLLPLLYAHRLARGA